MSFDVNPSEWKPPVNNTKAQSMDNDGRSKGGGGYSKASVFSKEEDVKKSAGTEISFIMEKEESSDFIVKENNWITRLVDGIFGFLRKILGLKS